MSDPNENQELPLSSDGTSTTGNAVNLVSSSETNITYSKSFDQIVEEVLKGEWGVGQEQRQRLSAAGFNHNEVRKAVTRLRNNP